MQSKRYIQAILCSGTIGMSATIVCADLRVDLRATSVNGVALAGAQSEHSIQGISSGDVIRFDVFAIVTGTDANLQNDKLKSICGSFKSSAVNATPNLLGTLKLGLVSDFSANPSSVGLQQDLDSDGDLDVGSNLDSSAQNYWAVRHEGFDLDTDFDVPAGAPLGAKVGLGSFTVGTASADSAALINFFGRNASTASFFRQDGVFTTSRTFDSPAQNGILISVVPEPGFICASIGGFGVAIGRRRSCPRRRRC
jgi:hypothetical protein